MLLIVSTIAHTAKDDFSVLITLPILFFPVLLPQATWPHPTAAYWRSTKSHMQHC